VRTNSITEIVSVSCCSGQIKLKAYWCDSLTSGYVARAEGMLSGFRNVGFSWMMVLFPPFVARDKGRWHGLACGRFCPRCASSVMVPGASAKLPLRVRIISCDCASFQLSSLIATNGARRLFAEPWPVWLGLADRIEELAQLLRTDTHQSLYGSGYEGYEE
jgi:hypothetical protein